MACFSVDLVLVRPSESPGGGKKTQKTKASCNDVREKESDEGIFGKTNGCDVQHVLDVSLIGVEKHLHIG